MEFTREETPTIMDGMVIRYKVGRYSEISASRNRVNIDIEGITQQEELDMVIEYLRRAFRQYVQLKTSTRGELFPEDVFNEQK
jgi:hypothetical protein